MIKVAAVEIGIKKVMIFMMEQEITSLNKHIIGKQWVAVKMKVRQVKMKVRQVKNDNQSVSATEQLQHILWSDALYYIHTVIIKWKEK